MDPFLRFEIKNKRNHTQMGIISLIIIIVYQLNRWRYFLWTKV